MIMDAAKDAFRQSKVLELRYAGFNRLVEVHAIGYSRDGHAIMRCWQLSGGGKGKRVGWRLIRLDDAAAAHISSDGSAAPRRGYKRGDRDMERILLEL